MKRSADWLAWSLQFIAGLIVGALFGDGINSQPRKYGGGSWLASEQGSTFIWGAALIGAGLASFYGDRLWWGYSYRVIPPLDMEHSNTSRLVSMVAGVIGSILVLTTILRHFGVF